MCEPVQEPVAEGTKERRRARRRAPAGVLVLLAGARSAELHAPDDILFAALLVKLFADRQLFPNPDAIQYLVTRIERSFKSAQIIVAQIDRIALSKQQAVTRNLISKILASADHSSD